MSASDLVIVCVAVLEIMTRGNQMGVTLIQKTSICNKEELTKEIVKRTNKIKLKAWELDDRSTSNTH